MAGHNKLREVFSNNPYAPVVKQHIEIYMEAYEEKWCCTCENYIPVDRDLSGVSTAYPECKLGGLALDTCEKYKRNACLMKACKKYIRKAADHERKCKMQREEQEVKDENY